MRNDFRRMKKIIFHLAILCRFLVLAARAEEPVGAPRDVLVYPDGDRVQGKLVAQEGNILVFDSGRFGVLRVPADRAEVIKAPVANPLAEVAAAAPATPAPKPDAPERNAARERSSMAALTAGLRDFFGPWTGRFAFSTEVVTDSADRTNLSVETLLKRKWKSDEVQLKGRYDFNQADGRTTTDMLKADGLWRHDFGKHSFVHYRPVLEWSRASFRSGMPSDYVLVQQELGIGQAILSTAKHKVRVGASENIFDVWSVAPGDAHKSRTAESAFLESDLKIPWGLLFAQRGVFYYSIATGGSGWENRIDLTKKFTETLSTAIRHELRRGSPDGTAQDYTRLKLLLGLDF